MKNRKLKVLSSSMLLAFAISALGSCGNNTPASSAPAGSSEESVSSSSVDSDASIAGRITFTGTLPVDILIGEDNAIDLEKYVTVTKVSNWSLRTTSETVRVEGHKVIGVDYGSFLVTIVAGTTVRAYEGQVVTKEKAAFNEAFNKINLNYDYYSALTGLGFVNGSYWGEISGYDDDDNLIFEGGIQADDDLYATSYEIIAAESESGQIVFADEITAKAGYAKSVEDKGYLFQTEENGIGGLKLYASDFVQQFDAEGDPTGYFILEAGEEGDDGNTIVSSFVNGIVGYDIWDDLSYSIAGNYSTKYNLAGAYDAESGGFVFYPCTNKGKLKKTFVNNGKSYSTAIQINDIGDCELEPCENWLKNPVYAEKIDTTPVQNILTSVIEGKKYQKTTYGRWYNPETGNDATCPSAMIFTDTKTKVFAEFSMTTYANDKVVEVIYEHVDPLTTLVSDDATIPADNETLVRYVKGGTYYSASGTKTDEGITYNEPVGSTEAGFEANDTIWDSNAVPSIFEKTDKFDLLSLSSFYAYEEDADVNKKTWHYNTNGPDMGVGYNAYYAGLPFLSMYDTPNMIPYCGIFYFAYLNWYVYCDITFSIVADEILNFNIDFDYSSDLHYQMGWSITIPEADCVSAAAMAVYGE